MHSDYTLTWDTLKYAFAFNNFFSQAGDLDYSAVLLGMLVMQDVQLGLFIAVMPTLIQAGASTYSRYIFYIILCHSLFF